MPVDPFVVHVARLRRTPGERQREVRSAPFERIGTAPAFAEVPPRRADSRVPLGADVTCDVLLEAFLGGVTVVGTVASPWVGLCRRCAVDVGGTLSIAVRERFVDPDDPAAGAWAAAPGSDEDVDPVVDDSLDLGPLVRDAVLLELPLAPLCRADCRGLCPQCGADRNEEDCRCVAPVDPRWASLDVLRPPLGGDRAVEPAREGT